MYKLLLAAALFISPICFSQDSSNHVRWEDTSATKKALDDTQRFLDSIKTANMYKESMQGLNYLLQYQKEQRAKQRKQAFLYIGLGIFFLVVLIVGVMRRTKSSSGK
jgi:hypothetical protein